MAQVIFDWLEFDELVIELDNLEKLIGITNLHIAEENENCGAAISAIQNLTKRIYLDLLAKQQAAKTNKKRG